MLMRGQEYDVDEHDGSSGKYRGMDKLIYDGTYSHCESFDALLADFWCCNWIELGPNQEEERWLWW